MATSSYPKEAVWGWFSAGWVMVERLREFDGGAKGEKRGNARAIALALPFVSTLRIGFDQSAPDAAPQA
jgi:hypothetical protein